VKDPGANVSIDRRKYPRVRTDSLVSIRRVETPPPALAHALDLSLGGIRFQCVGVELELGEVVAVTLTLGDRTASVVGRLVRVTDLDAFTQEVALAFLVVDDATQQLLRDALPEAQEYDPRDQ
jgi:hypothetical protein